MDLQTTVQTQVEDNTDQLIENLLQLPNLEGGRKRHLVIMSNGAFDSIYSKIVASFSAQSQ